MNKIQLLKSLRHSVFLLLLLSSFQAKSQIVSGSLTYEHIALNIYEVKLEIERYCHADSISNSAIQARVSCGQNSVPFTLKRDHIQSMKLNYCRHHRDIDPCEPQNTKTEKDYYGVERHRYKARIDLDSAHYRDVVNCCETYFEVSGLKRAENIHNIDTGSEFYTHAMLNRCTDRDNDLPSRGYFYFSKLTCINDGYYLSYRSFDAVNQDSISYDLVAPPISRTQGVSFIPPYTASKPLMVYEPLGPGAKPNPSARPPTGFYFDETVGDIIFTPTKSNSRNVFCVRFREWRNDDTSGKPELLTESFHEVFIYSSICIPNNPPSIEGPYQYEVCEGQQLCFDIESDDKPFVTPGQPSPPKDTVRLNWNRAIPGATFTIKNRKALHQTARFCWTPPTGSASDLIYSFVVNARDDACPRPKTTQRAFYIKVNKPMDVRTTIDEQYCNQYRIMSEDLHVASVDEDHLWHVLDTNGNLASSARVWFQKTKQTESGGKTNHIVFNAPGRYILNHQIWVSNVTCKYESNDTIDVSDFGTKPTIEKNGTFFTSNYNDSIEWFELNNDKSLASTDTFYPKNSGVFFLVRTQRNGCKVVSDTAHYGTVSVLPIVSASLSVYPNPSTGQVLVKMKDAQIHQIDITTFDGRNVLKKRIKSSKADLDLSAYAKGVYWIRVVGENYSFAKKLILQ